MSDEYYASGLFLSRMHHGHRRWLLLKNSRRHDWGFPKGHRNNGESDVQCALRECAEETGIALLEICGDPYTLDYEVSGRGLKIVNYYPAETQTDEVQLSKEHTDAQWFEAVDVMKQLPHQSLIRLFKRYLKNEGLA